MNGEPSPEVMSSADKFFEIALAAADKIRARLAETKIESGEIDVYRPLLYFFARAYKSCGAVRVLWAQGYVEDAHTITRTIFELRLQAKFMASDLEDRSAQFTENVFATALEYYRRSRRENDIEAEFIAHDLERLREEFRESKNLSHVEPKYQVNWWGGGGIKRLIEALALPVEKEYQVIYFMLSDHVHSSTSLAHRYATRNENALALSFAGQNTSSVTVPWSASVWLLEIGDLVDKALNLGMNDEIIEASRALLLEQRTQKAAKKGEPH